MNCFFFFVRVVVVIVFWISVSSVLELRSNVFIELAYIHIEAELEIKKQIDLQTNKSKKTHGGKQFFVMPVIEWTR